MKEDKPTKSTNAEMRIRIQTVYEMVIKGATRPFIIRYCAEKWQVGERTADVYLSKVSDMIEKTFGERQREKLVTDTLSKLSDLYVKNYTIEDFRECRNVLESRSKLLGLNEADKLKIQGDAENPLHISKITITDVDGAEI